MVTHPSAFPAFAVASGEEGSDPLVVHEGQTVRVDEFAASGHLDRLDADLADVAQLGIGVWRYGMPWRLAEPEPGVETALGNDELLVQVDRRVLQVLARDVAVPATR